MNPFHSDRIFTTAKIIKEDVALRTEIQKTQ